MDMAGRVNRRGTQAGLRVVRDLNHKLPKHGPPPALLSRMEGEPSAKRAKTEAPPAKPEGESVVERVRNILPKACALDDLLGSVERVRETAAQEA